MISYRNIGKIPAIMVSALLILVGCGSAAKTTKAPAPSNTTASQAVSGHSAPTPTHSTSSGGSAKSQPYDVQVIMPQTGSSAVLGKPEAAALKELEKEVNAQGGVSGRPIHFAIQDDESSPKVAVSLATQLIQRKVPVIIGSSLVGDCLAMFPLTKSGPVDYCMSPGVHPPSNSYDYSAGISTTTQMDALMNFLISKGLTHIAALTSTDASGVDGLDNLKKALQLTQYQQLKLVASQTFPITAVSVSSQLSVIAAAHPQVLLFWSSPGAPAGTAYRGISQSGLKIPVVTDEGNTLRPSLKAFAKFLPDQLYSANPAFEAVSTLPKGTLSPQLQAAAERFLKAFGPDAGIGQGLAWDPASIVLHVLGQVGLNANAQQIRNGIDNLHNFAGAMGVYSFSSTNHRGTGLSGVFVCRWNSGSSSWKAVSGAGGNPLK